MKKSRPIRMCIMCRKREVQSSLIRLTHQDGVVASRDGKGRSFYLCAECCKNPKKIKGLSKRFGQDIDYLQELIDSLQNR